MGDDATKRTDTPKEKTPPRQKSLTGAVAVASGIFLSRIMGLVRQKVFAFYFGNSDLGDAFYAALKIPNFLQNLLGDGVLSASFIPVYAKLRAEKKEAEADQVAGIIGTVLALLNCFLVICGVLLTPTLIDLIAPGFHGEKRELTILLVQIFFPGTALLVMSAWCLGILNSHRKFFLSYAAPVVWNLVIILAMLLFGSPWFGLQVPAEKLVIYTSWGVFVGSALQFLVQVPTVLRCAPYLKARIRSQTSIQTQAVHTIFRNFLPVITSRGAVQMSAYIDNVLASLVSSGAVSDLAYAQSLYMLPISLFGMSISAAELPSMSETLGSQEEVARRLRERLIAGLEKIAFLVVPSVVGFWFLGDSIVRALYHGGAFGDSAVTMVWGVLAGSTIGLLSTTWARLYSSVYYALKDTRTPLRMALIRVFLTTLLGYFAGLKATGWLGIDASWGTAGLTASAGVAGWVEFYFLRRALVKKIGPLHLPAFSMIKLWSSAIVAGGICLGIKKWLLEDATGHSLFNHQLSLLALLCLFGVIYFPMTIWLKIPQSQVWLQRMRSRLHR